MTMLNHDQVELMEDMGFTKVVDGEATAMKSTRAKNKLPFMIQLRKIRR